MPSSSSNTNPARPAPLFSVVTVCLNPGDGLRHVGESVLNQTSVELEWIVKDGLSADRAVCECPHDGRVRIVERQDRGIFDAMNQALEHCRGEYVHFLNVGDQFLGPQILERVAASITEHGRPEVLYTYYDYSVSGNVIKYPSRLTPIYLYRRSVCHQATFVRRDCYSRYGGFDAAFRVGADDELLARLILKHRVRQGRAPFSSVRVERWNFSAKPENRLQEERARCFIRQEYLTPAQRFVAEFLHAATFPALRQRWVNLSTDSRRYRLYVALSNFVNQHL